MPAIHHRCCCAFFLCLLLISSNALGRTVRVGFAPLPGFMEQNEDGRLTGFGVDFLQELGRHAGWNIEYVHAPWELNVRMLERGEIDMLAPLSATADGHEHFALPLYPVGYAHTVLYTRGDERRFAYGDYPQFDGLRVGMLQGDAVDKQLEAFSRQHHFTVMLTRFASAPALEEALRGHRIDAVLASSLHRAHDKKIIARFAPEAFYYAVRSNAPELLEELNQALEDLKITDPNLPMRLQEMYYGHLQNNLVYTRQEHDALQRQIVLRAVCCGPWEPLVQAQEQGEPTGIIPNIMNQLGAVSGCTFRLSLADNFATAVKMLEDGSADVLCDFTGQSTLFSKKKLFLSPPYLAMPMVVIARKNRIPAENWRSAAIPVNHEYSLYELLRSRQNLSPLYCESTEESLRAVADGRADITWCNLRTSNILLRRQEFSTLEGLGLCAEQGELRLAFSPALDPAVISALSKTVLHFPPEALERALMVLPPPAAAPLAPWLPWLCAALLTMAAIPLTWYVTRRLHEAHACDPLSGLSLLPAFRLRAEKLLRRAGSHRPAIICLHVQGLGGINEQHGLEFGDGILRRVGALLHTELHKGETAGKLAASYFLMLLQHEGREGLELRLNTLNSRLRALSHSLEFPFPVIMSMGVCLMEADESLNDAIDRALNASGNAASPHKNTCLFSEKKILLSTEAPLRRDLTADMESALHEGQFTAYFQVKTDMNTGAFAGAEALARWRHPRLGLLEAETFLPLFESNGFVQTLDMTLIEDVCQKLHLLTQDPLLPSLPIACNISRLHFQDDHFASRLLRLAERCQTPPALLMLDIQEDIALQYFDVVSPAVRQLRQAGFLICLENFGAKAAPLRLLTELRPDEVKLAPALVQNAMRDQSGEALLHASVSAAKMLGITVVAGAVERQEQADFLRRHHVRYAQGFLFGRPMPFADSLNLPAAQGRKPASASRTTAIFTTPPAREDA